MLVQHKGRNADFDQRREIAPHRRYFAVHRQPPCHQPQHHELEQQKRHIDQIERNEIELAVRDAGEYRWRGEVKHGHDCDQQRHRDDDRFDAQPLGQQDFAGQGIAKLRQHRRIVLAPEKASQQLDRAVSLAGHGWPLADGAI